jgi:type IV pilus assembly protein PilW
MRKQTGLSMVELLVALAISSFLMLGITQIYIDNKRSYLFQQGQTGNLESARHSLLILEQEMAKAGYRRQPDTDPEQVFPSQTSGTCSFSAGRTVAYIDTNSFCLRYEPAFANAASCAGTNIEDVPDTPYTEYSGAPVVALFAFDTSTGELRCNGQAIVSGIEDIRFEFGTNGNDEKVVSAYKSTPATTDRIRAIRYSALLASSTEVGDGKSAIYKNWSDKYMDGEEAPDKKLYSIVSSTISTRNLLP